MNVDVVRAMVILALHKEPDDDKAGYHIDRVGRKLSDSAPVSPILADPV